MISVNSHRNRTNISVLVQDEASSRPPRFYVPAPLPSAAGEAVDLDAEESRHAAKALRLAEGDAVDLCDGAGGLLAGRIACLGKKAVSVEALEPARQVHICRHTLSAPRLHGTFMLSLLVGSVNQRLLNA